MALPSDVIFEILSRTSLKALDKSKTVSKEWNQLVHSSNFMPTHCKNTNTTSGFYIQYLESAGCKQRYVSLEKNRNREGEILASSMQTREVEILASSMQGLLFVVRGNRNQNRRCYVCKPCTSQWQALPNPKLRFQTVKVALVVLRSEPLRYKIVRMYATTNYSNSYKCEIFDSETWKWKTSSNGIVLSENEFLNSRTQSVESSGLIYWLTDQNVIAFNPADETHSRFPLPESKSCSDFCNPSLIEYEGKLGFVNSNLKGDAELWVVLDSKTPCWRFIKEVESSTLDQTHQLRLVGFYNRDIALLKQGDNEMVFYNLQNSSIKEAVSVGYLYNSDQIFPFRSDCEPVNLKGE